MLDNYIECFFFPANGKMKTIEDVINEKRTEKETKKSSDIHSGSSTTSNAVGEKCKMIKTRQNFIIHGCETGGVGVGWGLLVR